MIDCHLSVEIARQTMQFPNIFDHFYSKTVTFLLILRGRQGNSQRPRRGWTRQRLDLPNSPRTPPPPSWQQSNLFLFIQYSYLTNHSPNIIEQPCINIENLNPEFNLWVLVVIHWVKVQQWKWHHLVNSQLMQGVHCTTTVRATW